MASWITPVFDRTQKDVEFAIQKIAEWIVGNNQLVVDDLKGCLNVSDINRIEGNIAYLSKRLTDLGYLPNTSTKTWSENGMPTEQDITRITNNVRALILAFYKPKEAPDIPDNILSYTEVNAIEENLYLIEQLLNNMVNSFRKSGAFQSGSTMFLPIRR